MADLQALPGVRMFHVKTCQGMETYITVNGALMRPQDLAYSQLLALSTAEPEEVEFILKWGKSVRQAIPVMSR